MFKVLVVQAQHNLSDARMEVMIRDRLSSMRFFGFDLGGAMRTRPPSAIIATSS
jgi:IS5 family transposase